ncbi:hypothetical protein B296_00041531 [Ensete ventricosum]|uniref:Uncharacterized protein n=1 Tax=Ensete ventricosum TaxID=4639 RepID=A0A426ZLE3_ENSVE|nr:hypothetical protein B296_00041531 [Ensete ventricosum]
MHTQGCKGATCPQRQRLLARCLWANHLRAREPPARKGGTCRHNAHGRPLMGQVFTRGNTTCKRCRM